MDAMDAFTQFLANEGYLAPAKEAEEPVERPFWEYWDHEEVMRELRRLAED